MCTCLLCQQREATMKGSHIIPSFFMKRINSIDGCNERDHELGFSIGLGTIEAYFGRDVYEDRRREYTDDESRIDDRTNLDIMDNVFCPECEKMFSKYEGKYSHTYDLQFEKELVLNTKVSGPEAALFWFSIIWRLSATKHNGRSLSTDFEEKLRRIVLSEDTTDNDIYYAVHYCKGYRKDNPTFALFDFSGNVATLIIDEFQVVLFNGAEATQNDEVLWGVNYKCDVSKLNDGIKPEKIALYPIQIFSQINNLVLHLLVKSFDFPGRFNAFHKHLFGSEMPAFIYDEVMEEVKRAKLADMYTIHNYAHAMKRVIQRHPDIYRIYFVD